MNTESKLKNCVACWEAIPPKALLCAKCGSFQQVWKNRLCYWSTIVGLLVFISTALAYLTSVAPEVWRMVTWKDRVKVLDVTFPGFIVLGNIGDGDVFVRKLYWTGTVENVSSTGTIPINTKVSKAQGVETIELKRSVLGKKEFVGQYMRSQEVPKEVRMKLWQEARSFTNECWDVKIQLTKSESMLETEMATTVEFWSVPLQGILYFDSLHANQTLEEKFTLLGFVVKNTNGKC